MTTRRSIKLPLVEWLDTAARIEERMDHGLAIPLREIRKYNELCYRVFPEEQDGAEFEREDAGGENPASSPCRGAKTERRFEK